ncbi:MAG: hypothetical protein WCA85_12855 [Paraburkholderia sp.]|uniref:hypothetical protein n=1 Tax=Paraburkholderia sp. TaxID=1926495 RepID=UPI003C39D1A0
MDIDIDSLEFALQNDAAARYFVNQMLDSVSNFEHPVALEAFELAMAALKERLSPAQFLEFEKGFSDMIESCLDAKRHGLLRTDLYDAPEVVH